MNEVDEYVLMKQAMAHFICCTIATVAREAVFFLIEWFTRVVLPLFHSTLKDVECVLIDVLKECPWHVLFRFRLTVHVVKDCTTTTKAVFAFHIPMMIEYFFKHFDLFHQFAPHHVRRINRC